MTRSRWITVITSLELLNALFWSGLSVFLFVLARQAAAPNAAEQAAGLKLAAAVMLVPAIVVFSASLGLRKGRLWAWWLALVANLVVTAAFVYSMIDDGWRNLDWALVTLTSTFAGATVLLLWPPVRRCYWRTLAMEKGSGTNAALNPPNS